PGRNPTVQRPPRAALRALVPWHRHSPCKHGQGDQAPWSAKQRTPAISYDAEDCQADFSRACSRPSRVSQSRDHGDCSCLCDQDHVPTEPAPFDSTLNSYCVALRHVTPITEFPFHPSYSRPCDPGVLVYRPHAASSIGEVEPEEMDGPIMSKLSTIAASCRVGDAANISHPPSRFHQQWPALVAALSLMMCCSQQSAVAATINVTTTQQGITNGQCSLQEAIYASEFRASTAIGSTNPDMTYTTGCTPGDGDDVI